MDRWNCPALITPISWRGEKIMKIAVFTSNQPRHIALVEALAEIADEVIAVIEAGSALAGRIASPNDPPTVFKNYFAKMFAAEDQVFGQPRFLPTNVQVLALGKGELNDIAQDALRPALDADHQIVFGASYIKGELCDRLVSAGAINLHIGISPFYRGAACNFWALHDRRPELVGATIHMLSKGLDSGDMLFHAVPEKKDTEPFLLGMKAVEAGQNALIRAIADGTILSLPRVPQDRSQELHYARNADFTEEVAQQYLGDAMSDKEIGAALRGPSDYDLILPAAI